MKQQQSKHAGKFSNQNASPQGGEHWVVIADHKKAHMYKKTRKGMERVPDSHTRCSHPFPEDGTGREDKFLRELAGWLNTAEREGVFDRLVLIAPASTVEEIRALIGEGVDTRICEGLDRDAAQVADDEAEDHLTEVMWH